MKHVKLFEQFVNEKVYRLSGPYARKGLLGQIMQAFKKQIERISFEGDADATLAEVNKEWDKFKPTAHKMILDQVEKATKNEGVLFVTARLTPWIKDEVNGLNSEGSGSLYISLEQEVVINVGFFDDVDADRYKRRFDKESMTNTPIADPNDTIMGNYDSGVGYNNIELRGNEVMQID